jgi:acyl-CoA thioester hydrolase
VINAWLIGEGGLDIHSGDVIGLCAESRCRFHGPLAFPETVEAGLRVTRLGHTSVRYEIALFGKGAKRAAATGWFVHVFVDRASRRPQPIPDPIRAALARLEVES